jgi:hypothetical protein
MGNKNSGPISDDIRTWCATQVREVALPKMVKYLQSKPVGAKDWHWCYEQLARIGQITAGDVAGKSDQERALELLA